MSNEPRTTDTELVVIVVDDNGHPVILSEGMYDDENAVFLSDDPRIPGILEDYPGARVMPWNPWSGEFEEVLARAAEQGDCRWIEDEHGGAEHVCVCEDDEDD